MVRRGLVVVITTAACGRIGFDNAPDISGPADACTPTGPWMNPTMLAEMSSPTENDRSPTMSADGLTIAIQRDAASRDIVLGERADRNSPFTPRPDLVAMVNTPDEELDPS